VWPKEAKQEALGIIKGISYITLGIILFDFLEFKQKY
jgi:hypothetical protein